MRNNKIWNTILGVLCVATVIGTTARAMTQDEMIRIWKLGEQYGQDYADYEFVKNGMLTQEEFNKIWPNSIFNTDKATTPTTPQPTPTPETPKCEHEYTFEVTLEPSCIAEGVKTFTCTLCGDTYDERIDIDTTAHSYECEHTLEANCIEKGEDTYTCTLCGDTYTQPVEMLGHDYISTTTTEPSCLKGGVKTSVCKNCGDTYTEDLEALGHDKGEWTIVRENTMFSDGSKELKCTRCNEVLETEVIPAVYPITYLYALIGAFAVIVIVIILLIAKGKGKKK